MQRNRSENPACDMARLRFALLHLELRKPSAWFDVEEVSTEAGMHSTLTAALLRDQAELQAKGMHDVDRRDCGKQATGLHQQYRLRRDYLLDLLGAYITATDSELPSNRQTHKP